MLLYFERRPKLRDFQSQISNLKSLSESCSRQLRAWADALQNSPIQGQRHLNNNTRKAWQNKHAAADWERNAMKQLPADHPMRQTYEKKHGPVE